MAAILELCQTKTGSSMPFNFTKTFIPDLIMVDPVVFGDDRGFFMESYKYSDFKKAGIPDIFIQDNHSSSSKGILRGLHYQKPPMAQAKLVRAIYGEILDVALDIRRDSPTFGKWFAIVLSAQNKKMLYIPKGFAHGFYVLSDRADVHYKASAEYSAQHDRGIAWDDPELAIEWNATTPMLSEKDKNHPTLANSDNNFFYNT